MPAELWRSQFSLTDLPTDRDGWHEVLESRLSDIAIADDDLTGLIAADPMFATVGTLTDLVGEPPRYSHPDGQYLIILTTVPAFDAEGAIPARPRDQGDHGPIRIDECAAVRQRRLHGGPPSHRAA